MEQISLTCKHEPNINMLRHPFFIVDDRVVLQALRMSRNYGVKKPSQKVEIIIFEREKTTLSHPLHLATTPHGVQKQFAY